MATTRKAPRPKSLNQMAKRAAKKHISKPSSTRRPARKLK